METSVCIEDVRQPPLCLTAQSRFRLRLLNNHQYGLMIAAREEGGTYNGPRD